MCFSLFFQWFWTAHINGWVVYCDNQFHWFARVAVCLLSSKNLYFFWFTQTNLASLIKKPWVFWFETSNLFFVHRKNKGFLIREAKLQPLLIYEIDCHSALHNLMFAVKTIEKTEQNTSRLTHVFSLPRKTFLLYFLVSKRTILTRKILTLLMAISDCKT